MHCILIVDVYHAQVRLLLLQFNIQIILCRPATILITVSILNIMIAFLCKDFVLEPKSSTGLIHLFKVYTVQTH